MKETIYEEPQLRVFEVKLSRCILSLSDGTGSQAPNVQALEADDIYSGDCSW